MNCPRCASKDVARIQYGLLTGPPADNVVMGGCVITQNAPDRHCHACGHDWTIPRRHGGTWHWDHAGFTASWASVQGSARTENQDAARCFEGRLAGRPVLVAAAFDGVGGLPGGKQAAQNAARRLRHVLLQAPGPEAVLPELHRGLPTGATTATVVALYMDELSAVLMHAGDSAAFAWHDGWKRLTPEQEVEQALGLRPEPVVQRFEAPQRLLVVSDGVDVQNIESDMTSIPAAADDASYVLVERGHA